MKRVALVFIIAVFVPSLVLAWLAVRSLRDQQLILERQQFLLYQGVADALAHQADEAVAAQQGQFAQQVELMLAGKNSADFTTTFDERLRREWPCALVGFVVTTDGKLTSPAGNSSTAAAQFRADFEKFLVNAEPAEVYANNTKQVAANGAGFNNSSLINSANFQQAQTLDINGNNFRANKAPNNLRTVVPSQQLGNWNADSQQSKAESSEAEFRQVVGDEADGAVARFVENKLKLLLWHRSMHLTNVIFGAQLSLDSVKQNLRPIAGHLDPALSDDVAVALLDDTAKPVAVSRTGFAANWKRPFVATELSETLPHWEMAVYLLNPAKLAKSAHTLALTLGLLTGVLLLAIGIGGWLIFADLNRELTLARQKTDFVSNVSHELKTPLTSIRMFSELLAEGRVTEPEKRQTYLNIITAETSRLTRLINNVLDFSRMERGEKKYHMQRCEFGGVMRETVGTYRPHLEGGGFRVECDLPEEEILVNADRDALAQVIVNLLSNAEKYSNGQKDIRVEMEMIAKPLPQVEARVMDRGPGVPRGSEERIFEKFYRAHDSLANGIQGSGLGLTLARQIARAHGGDVIHRAREGGGSCFILRLPMLFEGGSKTA